MTAKNDDGILNDPLLHVQQQIMCVLDSVLKELGVPDASITFEIPPDHKFGDLSTPVCMGLAKILKKNPREIAQSVVTGVDGIKPAIVERVAIAGPGYVNFFLKWSEFTGLIHHSIATLKGNYGKINVGDGKKVIVEHTSANPNKPIHLGTARCAVIGDLVGRILRMAGYKVEIENYIDDLGRQVAVLLHGYRNFKDDVERSEDDKDDYYLGLVYVRGATDIAEKEDGDRIVRDLLHHMEDPASAENRDAKDLVDKALKGQLQTLWKMNIFYDLLIWEHHVVSSGLFDSAIQSMQQKNPKTCYKIESGDDKDCVVLDMSIFGEKYIQNKKPYKILTRSNGVSTYTGKDVAFQLWKFGEASGFFKYVPFTEQPNGAMLYSTMLKGDTNGSNPLDDSHFGHAYRAINVIGFEQKFPQQVVRSSLKVLGFDNHFEHSQHLSFKHVWLPNQRFSGRKGTWIGFHADAAMEKAIQKAKEKIINQNPDLDLKVQNRLAEIIGVGAVKFYLARFDLEKEIVINWDELLNFEGNACPYVQYSCVRAKSILEKAVERGIDIPSQEDPLDGTLLIKNEEKQLYFILSQFPRKVEVISSGLNINHIPQYALEIADKFNSFYHACPVLKSGVPEGLRRARMLVVMDTITVLTTLLETTMGIQVPERM
ncbi:MAG: arginine--tRNA ligase [Promethearchaeota archaeon]